MHVEIYIRHSCNTEFEGPRVLGCDRSLPCDVFPVLNLLFSFGSNAFTVDKYCKSKGPICNFVVLQATVINGCIEEPTKHSRVLFVIHIDFFNLVETLDLIGSRVFHKRILRTQ